MTPNSISSSPSTRWQLSNGVWYLTDANRRRAIIEPAWDDEHWLLFAIGSDGEAVYVRALRRIAALKLCLLLWAKRMDMKNAA
jgi:hypothetical protein